jgi:hypothetical protein
MKRIAGVKPARLSRAGLQHHQTSHRPAVEHGFRYDSSLMADDIPYLMQTDKGELYEMPVHWGTDDWPPFAHYDEIGYMMPVKAPSDGIARRSGKSSRRNLRSRRLLHADRAPVPDRAAGPLAAGGASGSRTTLKTRERLVHPLGSHRRSHGRRLRKRRVNGHRAPNTCRTTTAPEVRG